jgi:drug/metabolite transporter (DMT)-like permease
MSNQPHKKTMTWMILFALLTVASWGVYGVFLHKGQMGMADPNVGRYKAFLWVGIAYFLVAVLAPLVMIRLNGKAGDTNFLSYPSTGWQWSLIAGIVGAVGAFGVLLAFGAAPGATPPARAAYVPVVMSIIFAGAPIVNAFVSMFMAHGPAGSHFEIKPQFWIGIACAAVGGSLVALYKPEPVKPAAIEQTAKP